MAETVRGINIVIGADTTKLGKALADVNQKSKDIQSELRQVERLLRFDPKNTTLLAQKKQLLAKQIENTSEKLNRLKSVQQQVNEQFQRGEISEAQYRAFQREVEQTEGQLRNLRTRLDDVNTALKQHTGNWGQLQEKLSSIGSSMKKVGESMRNVGQTLSTRVTLPIAGLGAAVIKTGADFEESMSKVAAISGATGKDFEKLREQAKELGATTRFSASEAASGMQFLAMAGFETNEIMSAMPGLLDLAAAGAMDLGRAADITSNIMSGFGIEASKAGHVADVLAKASSSANTNVEQLGEAMVYLAPISKTLGWTMEEATAAVMALSDAGIQGAQAGAAFSTSLGRLAKPTKEMQEVMKKLGLSFFDAQGNMKPLPAVIAELERGTKGMTAEQKSAALTTLFGAEAYKHWAVLIDKGSEALGANTEMLVKADGAAKQMAETMSDNTNGAFKEFASAVEGLSIALSDTLLPIVTSVIKKFTEWTRAFSEASPTTQKLVLALAAIAATIGPVLIVLGSLFSSIGTIATAFGALSGAIAAAGGVSAIFGTVIAALTGPIGIAIAAIVALIAAGVAIYKNWDEIKAKAVEIWGAIKDWFSQTLESIKQFFSNTWTSIKDFTSTTWENIKQITETVWNAIKDDVMAIVTPFVNGITNIFNGMKDGLQKIFDGLKQYFDGVWELIKNIFLGTVLLIVDLVTGDFEGLKNDAKTIFENMKNALNSIWEAIKNVFSGAVDAIKGFVSAAWENIKSNTSIVFNAVKSTISSIWEGIKSFFSTTIENIKTTISNGFNNMKNAVSEKMTAAKQTITDIWNSAQQFLSSINLYEIGRDIIQGLINGISSMAGALWEKAKSIADSIKNTIRDALDINSPSRVMRDEIGKWIPLGLAEGIEKNINAVIAATNRMAQATIPNVAGYSSAVVPATATINVPKMAGAKIEQHFYFHSTAPTPSEVARKNLQASRQLAMEWGL